MKIMRMFFYWIDGLAGLESFVNRKLIFEIDSLVANEDSLEFVAYPEGIEALKKITPGKTYAVRFEEDNNIYFKYYALDTYEITPPAYKESTYKIKLNVSPLTPST